MLLLQIGFDRTFRILLVYRVSAFEVRLSFSSGSHRHSVRSLVQFPSIRWLLTLDLLSSLYILHCFWFVVFRSRRWCCWFFSVAVSALPHSNSNFILFWYVKKKYNRAANCVG
jgi:hypothetical protein